MLRGQRSPKPKPDSCGIICPWTSAGGEVWAIQLDPNPDTASINLGYAYLNLPDSTNAVNALGEGVLGHPDLVALKQYGHLLIARRRWSGAADAFRRAFMLESDDVGAEYRMAFALDSAGKAEAARGEFGAVAARDYRQ